MDFVDEEQRPLAAAGQCVAGLLEHLAQILHAAGHSRKLAKRPPALGGQEAGERRFARSRRTVKDHGTEPVGGEEPAEELPFAEEMLLADELGQRSRPHAGRQRLRPAEVIGFGFFKE
jgi:hypothetical protein